MHHGGSKKRGTGVWSPERVIAHIDMDAFYASVEVMDDPRLEGKPVVVGGRSRRSVVSAANYEARSYGVHSAMPVFQAKKLCPHAVFLPGRMKRYAEVSRLVIGCLEEFSPLVEQVSVDEAFVDLTGTEHLFGGPKQTALSIKKRIIERTSLTCSIGVSTRKFIAKIASDLNKPDGICIIPPGDVRGFLDRLPVGDVPGVGRKSEESLKGFGIERLGDVGKFTREWIIERFGRFGERLIEMAEGGGGSPVVPYTPPKSVSTEETLEEDTGDIEVLERYLVRQSERVGRRLRRQGRLGRTVTVKIKYSDFEQVTRSVSLERPTQLGRAIYREASKLLRAKRLVRKVRLIGVGVSGLETSGPGGQLHLFDGKNPALAKWEKAERAMDEIIRRFGEGKVRHGGAIE